MQDHLQNHVARRAADASMVAAESTGPTWYLEQIAILEGVFGLVALGALAWLALRAMRRDRAAGITLAWTLGVLVPFSFAATKLPHYMLPAYPPLAIGAAAMLASLGERAGRVSVTHATGAALALVALLASPISILSGWGSADFSPHLAEGARRANEIAPGGTLAIWNEYHVAAAFYHEGVTLLWTDVQGFLDAYESTHGFVRGTHFEAVAGDEIEERLRADVPSCLLVRDDRRSAAIEALAKSSLHVEDLDGATLFCALPGD